MAEPPVIDGEFKAYDHNGKRSFSKNAHEPMIRWKNAFWFALFLAFLFFVLVPIHEGIREALAPSARGLRVWLGL